MMSDTTEPTLSESLRRAIVESGKSYKALERDTGVTRASIMRFVTGQSSLRLDMADRLAFGESKPGLARRAARITRPRCPLRRQP